MPLTNDSIESVNDSDTIRKEIDKALASGRGPAFARFLLGAIGGAIPFVGGAFSASANFWSEREQQTCDKLIANWLKLQALEIEEIGRTLAEVLIRIDYSDPKVQERIESSEYLSLIRKCFRDWSAAESEEKRTYVRNLLSNAAAPSQLCSDDVIRLFIKWIDDYSEAHFQVIKAVYNHSGITRAEIWEEIHGENVSEDSPEADLFKRLIRDLSMGDIIRQHRETDWEGNYLRKQKRRSRSNTLTSAFDNVEPYELTGLGNWFVHYTMNDIVPRIDGSADHNNNA